MSDLEVVLIILLVVGIIASNLAVLKYSTKFKLPQFGDHKKKSIKTETPAEKSQHTKKIDSLFK